MAPKHDRTAFIFAMAATILAIMTWAAFPNESDLAAPVPPKQTLYRTDWREPPTVSEPSPRTFGSAALSVR